jgi:hypothetical protein
MKVTVACTQMACSWDIEANINRPDLYGSLLTLDGKRTTPVRPA